MASIVEAAGGYGPRLKDVCNALSARRKTGWRIANVACETDLFVAARFVPAAVVGSNASHPAPERTR